MIATAKRIRSYQVFWKYRSGSIWHSQTFLARQAAEACFFRWMSLGAEVRWETVT